MKRVVILSTFLTPLRSGAEACAEEVALRLSDQFDITLVTARMRRSLPINDQLNSKVTIKRVGFGFTFDKWLFPFLAPLAVRSLKPDLIHAVLESFAGLALHFCRLVSPKAKRLLTLQTTNTSLLKKTIIRSPNAVTAISKALIKIAGNAGRNNAAHISNGIDLPAINSACANNPKVSNRILFAGRLEPMKGIDTLLNSFKKLISSGASEDTHLRIVGSGSQLSKLEKITEQLGLQGRVTFVGQVPADKVWEEYAAAEIFCGLSRNEALGNVFIEAQAAGCTVVGTNIGGIPDIITDQVNGLLVEPDNIETAAAALKLLLEDKELKNQLALLGKQNAQSYDWDTIAGKYQQVYSELL